MIWSFDTETHPIKPGLLAPRMVCLSYQEKLEDDTLCEPVLQLRPTGLAILKDALMRQRIIVAHNLPYDFGVAAAEDPSLLPLIFQTFRDGTARCTIVRQMLLDIAFGMRKWRRVKGKVSRAGYALTDLLELYFDEVRDKENTPRLRYGLLDGVPVEQWSPAERDYAIDDAVDGLRIYEAQEAEIRECLDGDLPNQVEQQRANWALHLMSMWGVRADPAQVDRFISHCEEMIDKMHFDLDGTGIFKTHKKTGKRSRVMAEIRRRVRASLERLQVDVPLTPTGFEQTDKETLQLTDDPDLHVLAESLVFEKHLGQWGPVTCAATQRPVCARYNPIVETGRTSCSGSEGQEGTNFQNPPRKGDVRPCFIPRRGWLYCSTDADTIELRAHAQNCLELVGWSKMADALLAQAKSGGPDLHEVLAANILEITPDELQRRRRAGDAEAVDARQFAKIPNFGFPGGMGAEALISFAATQMDKKTFLKWFGATRDEQIAKAQWLRELWFETFPENRVYFQVVGNMIDRHAREGTVVQLMSGRIRGGTRFTAACNGFFQGRVADAMKEILWVLAYECYTGKKLEGTPSPLYGSRPVMFLHDEPILEHPEDGTETERAERQQEIVVEVLSRWMPDIPCTSTAVLMRRWQKGAEPVWQAANGSYAGKRPKSGAYKLVPVRPEKVEGKTKWVHDIGEARLAA